MANRRHDDALFLTVPEAASVLRVCKNTVFNRLQDGTLQKVKLGRRTLVLRSSLLALCESATN